MQQVVRSVSLLAAVACAAALASGCQHSMRVDVEEDVDFAAYRTWGWRIAPAAESSDLSAEQTALVEAIASHISSAMLSRGFTYVRSEPDLLVTPELRIRRRRVVYHHAEAERFLPSLHASPNYSIEGVTTEEVRIVESSALEVVVAERVTGRVVWRALLQQSFEGGFEPHAGQSVATLMDPFPAAAPVPGVSPRGAWARADDGSAEAAR